MLLGRSAKKSLPFMRIDSVGVLLWILTTKIANDLKNDKEHYEQQLLELTANDKSYELDAATLLWVAQHVRELYRSFEKWSKRTVF